MSFAKGIKTFCFHIFMHFRIVKIKGSRIIGHSITIKNNCWQLFQDAELFHSPGRDQNLVGSSGARNRDDTERVHLRKDKSILRAALRSASDRTAQGENMDWEEREHEGKHGVLSKLLYRGLERENFAHSHVKLDAASWSREAAPWWRSDEPRGPGEAECRELQEWRATGPEEFYFCQGLFKEVQERHQPPLTAADGPRGQNATLPFRLQDSLAHSAARLAYDKAGSTQCSPAYKEILTFVLRLQARQRCQKE